MGGWPPLDKWVKSLKLINEKQRNDKHTHSERAYQGPHIYTDANYQPLSDGYSTVKYEPASQNSFSFTMPIYFGS